MYTHISVQFSSVAQSCPTLCDPMDHSMPGLPVHHQLPEFTQTLSIESVMPSNHLILCHPLLLPPSIFPSLRVFSNESALRIRWPKYWSFSFNIRTSNEYSGLVGSSCSPRDSQESSPTPRFKSINSSALRFLYSPTLISIHDHWKNHSLDWMNTYLYVGLPWWLSGKESACQCRKHRYHPWVWKIPWRRKCQPTPVFLTGKSHG